MAAELDPDAALMLRVQQGDLSAFEALVDKFKQPVFNLISRSLPDSGEVEDLAQMVFIQVYKSAARYRATAKFSTWLYTIARNLCLNELRRRSRHPADSLDAPAFAQADLPPRQFEDRAAHPPTETLLQQELVDKVEEALAQLPENQRTAILLFRDTDMSYEDIARVLRTSVSATKSLIHRGRETLKARLKPYLRSGVWNGPD